MCKKLAFLLIIYTQFLAACNNAAPENVVENQAIENTPAKGEMMSRADTEAWILKTLREYSVPCEDTFGSGINEYSFDFEDNFLVVKYRFIIRTHGVEIMYNDNVYHFPIKTYKETRILPAIMCSGVSSLFIRSSANEVKRITETTLVLISNKGDQPKKTSDMSQSIEIPTSLQMEDRAIKQLDDAFLHLKEIALNEKEPF